MAKKTFGDVLKSLLGSKLDEEIDIDDSVLSQANKEDQVDKDKPTEEEKSKVIIDYEKIEELGIELIESDLLVLDEGTLKHDSLMLSTIVFSYLMKV